MYNQKFVAMSVSDQSKNLHLLSRAAFGLSSKDAGLINIHSPKKLLEELNSKEHPVYLDKASADSKEMAKQLVELKGGEKMMEDGSTRKDIRREFRRQSNEDTRQLAIAWMDVMVNDKAQLREKMSLFWHGHYACRDANIFYTQDLLDIIRRNALGNFGDLLKSVSKSAAMIGFLNNQQNKKQHPNENFAREVMELFTLGRGNYTEEDIKEAARAFTGWNFEPKGTFTINQKAHDDGIKNIFGKTGNFTGDDVLNMLLENKQTARHIVTKIYRYFVNDSLIDTSIIEQLTNSFYQSNYDIAGLMRTIFLADWFYDAKNVCNKIKSPVELFVGIRRLLPMQMEKPDIQLLFTRALGQELFEPPNVAGWPGGTNWIDSSSLMVRLVVPRLIQDDTEFQLSVKPDDDTMMGNYMKDMRKAMEKNNRYKIKAKIDWNAFNTVFEKTKKEGLMDHLQLLLVNKQTSAATLKVVQDITDASSRESFIRTATIAWMSTPEFQMC